MNDIIDANLYIPPLLKLSLIPINKSPPMIPIINKDSVDGGNQCIGTQFFTFFINLASVEPKNDTLIQSNNSYKKLSKSKTSKKSNKRSSKKSSS